MIPHVLAVLLVLALASLVFGRRIGLAAGIAAAIVIGVGS